MIADLTLTPPTADPLPAPIAPAAIGAAGGGDFAAALAQAAGPQTVAEGTAAPAPAPAPEAAPPSVEAILSRLATRASASVPATGDAAARPDTTPIAADPSAAFPAPADRVAPTAAPPAGGAPAGAGGETGSAADSSTDPLQGEVAAGGDTPATGATTPGPIVPPQILPTAAPATAPASATTATPKTGDAATTGTPATTSDAKTTGKTDIRGARPAAPRAPMATDATPEAKAEGKPDTKAAFTTAPLPAPPAGDSAAVPPAPALTEALSQTQTAAPPPAAPRQMPLDTRLPDWEARLADGLALRFDGTGQEIELMIQPETLGPVEIRIGMEDGAAQVRIVTDNPHAAQLFQQAEARLADALARAGLVLAQHDAQARSGRDPRHRPRGGDGDGGADALPAAANGSQNAALSALSRRPHGLLNIVA